MHFATLLSFIAPLASAVSLSYDAGYADGGRSLTAVSCSDGSNGLINRYGWSKQSDIPRFPYIGGSSDIAGWTVDAWSYRLEMLSAEAEATDRLSDGYAAW